MINSDLYREYLRLFLDNSTLEDFINLFSVYVWENQRISKELPNLLGRNNEVQFTNYFISNLMTLSSKSNSNVRTWHSKNESANGNDIELIIEVSPDEYLLFPCQCKKLKFDSKLAVYSGIWHSNLKGGYQIDNLIEYADSHRGTPLYMLYNYVDDDKWSEEFGASVLNARIIVEDFEKGDKISYKDLHPPSISLIQFIDGGFERVSDQPTYTSLEEIHLVPGWDEINPPIEFASTRFVFSGDKVLTATNISTKFIPKYRILVSSEVYFERFINFIPPKKGS